MSNVHRFPAWFTFSFAEERSFLFLYYKMEEGWHRYWRHRAHVYTGLWSVLRVDWFREGILSRVCCIQGKEDWWWWYIYVWSAHMMRLRTDGRVSSRPWSVRSLLGRPHYSFVVQYPRAFVFKLQWIFAFKFITFHNFKYEVGRPPKKRLYAYQNFAKCGKKWKINFDQFSY